MELKVKEVIKAKGLTMQQVAETLGVTRDTLTRNINGNPTISTLEKIADALGVPVIELFEKPNANNVIGFVKVGDTVHEVKSAEDVKDLAGKL